MSPPVLGLLALLLIASSSVSNAQRKGTLQVKTDPLVTFQSIDGFGASDAWRVQYVGKNYPLEKRNYIADLLFSQETDDKGNPEGIGLSIWRFNLSAGSTDLGDDNLIGLSRSGECFLNADGSYDWTKLEGQRWFINAAKERGVEKLLAFPNSPPVYYTRNGQGFAPEGVIHLNLKPGYMDDYAKFMAEVMEHFNDEGIFFDYLSPVNEPQWNWNGHSQEGTPAMNEEIHALVLYLSKELSSRNLKTQVIITEAGSIGHAAIDMSKFGMPSDGRDNQAMFFFNEDSPFYIGDLPNVEKTISAHSYHSVWPVDFQVQSRISVDSALKAANPDLGYWMSEYCILQKNDEIGSGSGRDLTMKTALYVARIMHHDMVLTNAKSWQWWTALTGADFKDGLVYLLEDPDGKTGKTGRRIDYDGLVRESKLLWVMGNYSRFVRPGMVRIKCELSEEQSPVDGVLASAYKNPENGQIVHVITNLSENEVKLDFGATDKAQTYTTDKDQDMGFALQKLNKVTLPSRSVVTVLK